ncbi:MAG: NrfD/PsrC family molybdoenzyme membrane anchor subunit [Candidatus Electrothrix sp. GW3-4]|uniref:NrfD/PsrC family molybdoenzyme membrane anchor subunit n=1 Tax=Candidatus Electrothrix sp. GW3-4 TaxID=3126740 RepID=UPI0030D28BEA
MKKQIASASQKPIAFARDFFSYAIKGGNLYYGWLLFLSFFVVVGLYTSYVQMTKGLIVTGATDQIIWELFISNFIFTAHIAAAAVLVVIPAYIYKREDMKHLAVLGEIIALTFVIIGLNFIFFHMGRPDRFWHAIPGLGIFNFPSSMLTYDIIVLNTYLGINLVAVSYLLYKRYLGQPINTKFYTPLIYVAVAWGPLIHIVTAFILSSNAGISAWHTAVLPFAFLSMAGASGSALIIIFFLLIRKFSKMDIADSVIDFFSQVIVWSLGIIILVFASEFFTELYPGTHHAASLEYMIHGHHGLNAYVPWFWWTMALIVIPFILLLSSKVRKSYNFLLPLISLVVFLIILIEKPAVLVFPSFSPTPLGEYAVYHPTLIEIFNVLFIWASGFIILTLLTKGAIGVLTGEVQDSQTVEGDAK